MLLCFSLTLRYEMVVLVWLFWAMMLCRVSLSLPVAVATPRWKYEICSPLNIYCIWRRSVHPWNIYSIWSIYVYPWNIYMRRSVHPCNIFMKEICSPLKHIYEGDLSTPATYLWRRSVHPCNIFMKEICSPLQHIYEGDLFTPETYLWRRSVHPCNIFKKEICSPLKHILLGDLFTRTPYITTVPSIIVVEDMLTIYQPIHPNINCIS